MKPGRITRDWLKFRKQWLKDNPPNFQGYYDCALCGRAVHESRVELDHKKNRSTNPELRFEASNLQTCHSACNVKKKLGEKYD